MSKSTPNPLLVALGSRIRHKRAELGLTQRELAVRARLSARFLADVEAGRGNIAVTRLATLARVLGTPLDALVVDLPGPSSGGGVLALLGMRGAGKSTLGHALADRLGLPLVEHDELIQEMAGMALGEIFNLHGADYFLGLARESLDRLFAGGARDMVLATTGNIVGDAESFELLKRRTHTIWLKADPHDHWQRVLDQGDFRPGTDRPQAFAELIRLLDRRAPLYAESVSLVDTSALGEAGALTALLEIANAADATPNLP